MYSTYTVVRKVRESEWVYSLYLKPADGRKTAPFQPGQHLLFKFNIPGSDIPLFRNYSFSDCWNEEYYRVSVKKEQGLCSSFIFNEVEVGSELEARGPQGTFVMDVASAEPVLLIAGGIGITPLLCMLKSVASQNPSRKVTLLYGVNGSSHHSFKNEINLLRSNFPGFNILTFYASISAEDRKGVEFDRPGLIDLSLVDVHVHRGFYLCGPAAMMEYFRILLLEKGVFSDHIFTESFVAPPVEVAEELPQNGGLKVNFSRRGATLAWDDRFSSLLEFSEANGIEIDSGCLFGDCGTCLTKLLDGEVKYLHPTMVKPGPGNCLPCSCIPVTDISLGI